MTVPNNSIFINYRRDDSAIWSAHLARELRAHMGEKAVFFDDTTGIPLGSKWPKSINIALDQCRVFLPVIAPTWHTGKNLEKLTEPEDWVRKELFSAYTRRHSLLSIPVFVNNAEVLEAKQFSEDAELEMVILELMEGQGIKLDPSIERWPMKIDQLVDRVEAHMGVNIQFISGQSDGNVNDAALEIEDVAVADDELVDRSDEIEKHIADKITHEATNYFAIIGESGSGKTQLAIQLAKSLSQKKVEIYDSLTATGIESSVERSDVIIVDNYWRCSDIANSLKNLREFRYVFVICESELDASHALRKLGYLEEERKKHILTVPRFTKTEMDILKVVLSQEPILAGSKISKPGWDELGRKARMRPAVMRLLFRCAMEAGSFDWPEVYLREYAPREYGDLPSHLLNHWFQKEGGQNSVGHALIVLCTCCGMGMTGSDLIEVLDKNIDDRKISEITSTLTEIGLIREFIVNDEVVYIPVNWVSDVLRELLSLPSKGDEDLKMSVRSWRARYIKILENSVLPWASVEAVVLKTQIFFEYLWINGEFNSTAQAIYEDLSRDISVIKDERNEWENLLRSFGKLSRDCSATIAIMNCVSRMSPSRALGDLSFRMRHHDSWANAACIFGATYHWLKSPSVMEDTKFDFSDIEELKNSLKRLDASDDWEIAAIFGALTTMGEWNHVASFWMSHSARFNNNEMADLTFLLLAVELDNEQSIGWFKKDRWNKLNDGLPKISVAEYCNDRLEEKLFVDRKIEDERPIDYRLLLVTFSQSNEYLEHYYKEEGKINSRGTISPISDVIPDFFDIPERKRKSRDKTTMLIGGGNFHWLPESRREKNALKGKYLS